VCVYVCMGECVYVFKKGENDKDNAKRGNGQMLKKGSFLTL
jgi:hypothetical protein